MKLTGRELLDNGWWMRFCDVTGTNEWCINEGLADDTTEFELTAQQANEIGILREVAP